MSSYLSEDSNFAAFSNQLSSLGLKLRDIPGDGNCLFRALGDQLDGHSDNHCSHREATVEYMIQHRDDFEPFVEDDVPFNHHVINLRMLGTYAGNDAIVAFARNNNVNVVIHQLNAPIWTIKGCDNTTARQLHIAYHNGDHYSSIRKQMDNSNKPANIKLSECKETENVISRRSGKKKSDLLSDSNKQKIAKISKLTDCENLQLIIDALNQTDDENEAVGFILKYKDLAQGNRSSYTDYRSTGIWSENGTGTRIFGSSSSGSKNQTNKPKNAVDKKLKGRKKQDLMKRERKKRNELRKKNNTPSDSEDADNLTNKLSVLNV